MAAYSYSAIKDFENCARKYHETRILKKWPFEKTRQILYGESVHKALELYIRDGKPLGEHSRFHMMITAIDSMPGRKTTEYKMAVNNNLEPCDWLAPEVFMRGVADITIMHGVTAYVGDFKTGKPTYADPSQLELMALMIFQHHPEITVVRGMLMFLLYDQAVEATYRREDARTLWAGWVGATENIEKAVELNVFQENPSGLCGWCPVATCPHHKPRRS